MICSIIACVLTGCGFSDEDGYDGKNRNQMAKLEIYEAESGVLLKTIEDEEILHQYNQVLSGSEDRVYSSWEEEYEDEYEEYEAYEAYEEKTKELKETAEAAGESVEIIAYKDPAARFGSKELEKNHTITLYRDSNIAKMTVAEESIKNISLPEEFVTFYFEMLEEEMRFYEGLAASEGE